MSYKLIRELTPRARKDHQCVWCGEKIFAGHTYLFERSVFDGRYQNHRWHFECATAAKREAKAEGGEITFDLHCNPRPEHAKSVAEAQAIFDRTPQDTLRKKLAMGDLHVAKARETMGSAPDEIDAIVITDMLGDLMHVCERDGISFEDCFDDAADDYELEREELPE